jgi:hypothetical protein
VQDRQKFLPVISGSGKVFEDGRLSANLAASGKKTITDGIEVI